MAKASKSNKFTYVGDKKPINSTFLNSKVSTLVGTILISAETVLFLVALLIIWLTLK